MEKKFDKLVAALEKKKVPCKVSLNEVNGKQRFIVECGWDFPDRIADKVLGTFRTLDISDGCCCAEHGGGVNVKVEYVCGGKKRYGRTCSYIRR